jgi:hypothetical protein
MLRNFNFRGFMMFLLFAAFSFTGCESPLSDVEITDPSLLQTNFAVERSLLDDGTVTASLHANIFDKNLASIQLKNGKVKVNGQEMSLTEILNITTYHIPSASVNLNTTYNFEIILPNGQTHTGAVTTQGKTFTSMTVPQTGSVNSDLTVSWQDVYVHDVLTISLGLKTSTANVAGATFTLTPQQMQAGTFVIPKSNFASPEGITEVTVTLSGAKYGTIDPKFRSGSGTISRMRVEKKVKFQ